MKPLIKEYVEGTLISAAVFQYRTTPIRKRLYLTLPSISGRNGRYLLWVAKSWWKMPFTKPYYYVWSEVKVTCNHCGEDANS